MRRSIAIVGVVKDAKYLGVPDEIARAVYFAFMEDEVAKTTEFLRVLRFLRLVL